MHSPLIDVILNPFSFCWPWFIQNKNFCILYEILPSFVNAHHIIDVMPQILGHAYWLQTVFLPSWEVHLDNDTHVSGLRKEYNLVSLIQHLQWLHCMLVCIYEWRSSVLLPWKVLCLRGTMNKRMLSTTCHTRILAMPECSDVSCWTMYTVQAVRAGHHLETT